MLEGPIQSRIRLASADLNIMLWRNNSGAFNDVNGRLIRFGLGNDSKKINKEIKSSDLIGIRPTLITQEMVGKTIGVFVSIETKSSTWQFKNTDREKAQANWINTIRQYGGLAGFAKSVDDFYNLTTT